jgi:hypothetical protein
VRPKDAHSRARDFIETNPVFALEAGLGSAALAREGLRLRNHRS